ncbi:hypothetical protein [Caenispirillum salinarum]|uniref:hypothetical protein n=1 Tax=Caenispirillum salinarum TaxID=859058 RepID=UPI00384F7BF0
MLAASLCVAGPAVAETNISKAQAVAVPFDKCKPEKGVTVTFDDSSPKLSGEEIAQLLTGNTLLSVDRYGTFALYYPEKGKAIGWMPKEKDKGYSWSAGKVSFEGGKYCRTWDQWNSGKYVNCWNIYRSAEPHVDRPGFYFACENGVPDGDIHVVLPGNYFEVEWRGTGKKGGRLTQSDEKTNAATEKYFGKYVNK